MSRICYILLGWALLLPPWVAPYKVNESAPFSEWKRGTPGEFASFQACANFKTAAMAAFEAGTVKENGNSIPLTPEVLNWNYRMYWNSRCVAE